MIAFVVGIHDGIGLAAPDGTCRIDQIQPLQVCPVFCQRAAKFADADVSFEIEARQHVNQRTSPGGLASLTGQKFRRNTIRQGSTAQQN